MNTLWTCDKCNKPYKTLNGFTNHQVKCKNQRNDNITLSTQKKRKKKISPQVRFDVWKTYIGNFIEAKCFCCWKNSITPFTYCNTFHAGHITAEANGGEITIGNLLPICKDCNSSMGTTNWDEYINIYTNFSVRNYGDNLPKTTIKHIKIIQKYYKQFIKNKKNKKNKKRRKTKIPNYLKPTQSFLRKTNKKTNV